MIAGASDDERELWRVRDCEQYEHLPSGGGLDSYSSFPRPHS